MYSSSTFSPRTYAMSINRGALGMVRDFGKWHRAFKVSGFPIHFQTRSQPRWDQNKRENEEDEVLTPRFNENRLQYWVNHNNK
ncbi:hypothetical protein E3N88_32095 [Mikania micrantha]|uniref:Uncharacterized protein n=1 Tax=Mikania micrantha TaxID=192012 RepID=A0A5N6M813_9ASTR|nr:hypothetical protein E3N88_32095 [Mikania micrantha]